MTAEQKAIKTFEGLPERQIRQMVYWLIKENAVLHTKLMALEDRLDDLQEANNLWSGR